MQRFVYCKVTNVHLGLIIQRKFKKKTHKGENHQNYNTTPSEGTYITNMLLYRQRKDIRIVSIPTRLQRFICSFVYGLKCSWESPMTPGQFSLETSFIDYTTYRAFTITMFLEKKNAHHRYITFYRRIVMKYDLFNQHLCCLWILKTWIVLQIFFYARLYGSLLHS